MNAALRAVVRSALHRGVEVLGFHHGWRGVISEEVTPLNTKSVGGIINLGGTILRSARCREFREPEGRAQAMEVLRDNRVEGLVVIGGDGSLTGAKVLMEEHDIAVMGVPGSIDNDIAGTDYAIGFDTAVNTARDAIDKVRDTAYSHDRVFVIEVMGRNNGFIAVDVALACGAEGVLIPEFPFSIAEICENLKEQRSKGKSSSIVVVAEGAGKGNEVCDFIVKNTGLEARAVVLGHMQRGGSPSAFDRVLALRLGALATNRLLSGYRGEMAGLVGNRLVTHPLSYVLSQTKTVDAERLLLLGVMAQ
ncbi:MAG: 6-phosphofructokinase [Fimbriimonadaceae bacterium]|nr:6-phosphofructokinase [Fimbriimonadaceae bacterium]